MNIVVTSFTPSTAPGGVPRWNRDFLSAFPEGRAVHYSWSDVFGVIGDSGLEEWEKARVLCRWLRSTGRLKPDDVLVGDGFWADAAGYHPPERTVSVCHGNWSHTTQNDVLNGIPPEFPGHHAAQLAFRKRLSASGGRLVAVSDFIAFQCRIQWELVMPVIDNGANVNVFRPHGFRVPRKRPVVVHAVTTGNKGFDHVRLLERRLDADVIKLDHAADLFNRLQSERRLTKYQALSQADLVVVPSAHEGNSYFVLETLASDVPVVAYNVGLMWRAWLESTGGHHPVGLVLDRDGRTPEKFLSAVSTMLDLKVDRVSRPREWVSQFSLENFQSSWRKYIEDAFGPV